MASSEQVLTYHVVPRFDIAAKGGPLALGTVVTDIKRLIPLNRGQFHVKVPEDLKYAPVIQTNFKDTLIKARNANIKGWLKACGLPVGASASIGGSKDLENTVSCESIVTTYFDPDPAGDYVKECLAVKPIQGWLDAAKGHTADLHIVTGLKVAKKLMFNKSSSAELHAGAEAEMSEPHTQAVDAGAGIDVGGKNQQALEFEVDDIVIGIRLNRYRCVKRLFRKGRVTKYEGVLDGDLMSDQKKAVEQPEIDFELTPILEEAIAREQAAAAGETECWIGRDA
ncbi:hypothetical protein F5Y19DRAFT_412140 [Xylariaceae sp. FL1651]|nr:hypothetical protein F5Y19DRAFT_412140 [Xylariaceae sp. FL1651]